MTPCEAVDTLMDLLEPENTPAIRIEAAEAILRPFLVEDEE